MLSTSTHRWPTSTSSWAALAVVLVTVASTAHAQQADPFLTQHTSGTTAIVLRVRTGEPHLPSWVRGEPLQSAAAQWMESIQQATAAGDLLATVDVPYASSQPAIQIYVPQAASAEERAKQLTWLNNVGQGEAVVRGSYLATSPTHTLAKEAHTAIADTLPPQHGVLKTAAETVATFPLQLVVAPPRYVWDTVDETLPELPAAWGGGSTKVLTEGLQWLAIGIDPAKPQLQAFIQSATPSAAKAFAEQFPEWIRQATAQLPPAYRETIAPAASTLLSAMDIRVDGSRITVRVDAFPAADPPARLLAGLWRGVTGPVTRSVQKNRMRQIVLGILNYESANGSMPPGKKARNEDGKSGLSWRVHILPYIGEIELYNRFHLEEPWDSPHNRALVTEMPDVYRLAGSNVLSDPLPPGHTTYLAPAGKGTIFGQPQPTKIGQILDGTSLTLAVVEVEAERAVPWTAPRDYRFEEADPGAGLAWDAEGTCGVMSSDGAWHVLRKQIDPQTLLHLFQMNDGEPVRYD